MDSKSEIIVTGAAGFIGSCLAGYLNNQGYNNLILVDDFGEEEKEQNYINKSRTAIVRRTELFEWLATHSTKIDFVFHLGARTDTTEFDYTIHERLNVEYSQQIWSYCAKKNTPLIYASSAATYGNGELGYSDDHDLIKRLKPLNPYGISKNEFDKWVLNEIRNSRPNDSVGRAKSQIPNPPSWAGLKFFNVYGPNEYHKGRMASVIFHAFNQIRETGKVKLFRSHNANYRDGEQLRDFIYVDDVLKIMFWMMTEMTSGQWPASRNGIYNVGTGKARTFKDLVTAIFASMDLTPSIQFIDTPEDIRDKYQYFTEADMTKLRQAGYTGNFTSLEEGVATYVRNFLLTHRYY